MIKAFSYLRYSKEEDSKTDSIQNQDTFTKEVATYKGDKIIKTFKDEETGKHFNRSDWKQMLKSFEKYPDVKKVYVKKIDRIGRTTEGWDQQYKILKKYEIQIFSCTEGMFVSDDFQSKLYMLLAEHESKQIGLRTKIGMQQSFKKGKLIIRPPLGYRKKVKIVEDKVVSRRLIPIKKEVDFVKEIFNYYSKTKKLYITKKTFEKKGIMLLKKKIEKRKSKYKTSFSLNYVKSILSNPIYIGYLRHIDKETKKASYIKLKYIKPIIDDKIFFSINPELKKEIENA